MANERYSRQILFKGIGEAGQERLWSARATIIGCGALGSGSAERLVRAGVGAVRLCDRDFVELDNLQRQSLYDESDVKASLPKAVAAANKLRTINSSVAIEPVVVDVTPSNIEQLIEGSDVVIDGTDNFETRFLLNDACVKNSIPWIYGACVGSYGLIMPVVPGKGPCLRCLLPEIPAPGKSQTCDTVGVLNTIASTVSAIQCNEAIKLLTGNEALLMKGPLAIDLWSNAFRPLAANREGSCKTCSQRIFEFLDRRQGSDTVTFCGRNAVQVTPGIPAAIDFPALAEKLSKHGKTVHNAFLLKFATEKFDMTLFPDGRAIIKGVSETSAARTIYSKYIGI